MSIQVFDVTKKFDDFTALQNISLEVAEGERVALLGPSGSGKTTLLRVISGLEPADSGRVVIRGNEMTDEKVSDRKVGFVFQHYALFRHMSVFENVAFGLRVRSKSERPGNADIKKRVLELLKLVRLDSMASRYPSQLSGGQRQRVALARALAIEPNMLLLDEPFGALDAKVRRELRQWLRELHDKLGMTSIFVTHDQEEALELADRVVVMNRGRIEQIGTPDEIYHHPANEFVCEFLGNVNFFHCRLEGEKVYLGNTGVRISDKFGLDSKHNKVYIRPHRLEISRVPAEDSFGATIRLIHSAGPLVRVEIEVHSGERASVELSQERFCELDLKKGEAVYVVAKEIRAYPGDYSI